MKKILLFVIMILSLGYAMAQDHFEVAYTEQPQTYMNIYVFSASVGGNNLGAGDEIAVFDGTICCGVYKVSGAFAGPVNIPAAKAEAAGTGYTAGNPIVVKIWDASAGIEYSADVSFRENSPNTVFTNNESAYLDISAKVAATIQLTASNKTYDGTTTADVGYTVVDGSLAGDITVSVANGLFADKHAGSGKPVTADITVTGADIENFDLTIIETTTATISKKTVEVINAVAQDKVYNGNAVAVVSGASLAGVITPDEVIISGGTSGTFAQSSVGNSISVTTAMTLTGSGASNYELKSQPTLSASITKAPLTVTAENKSKTYDGQVYSGFTSTIAGFVGGETQSVISGSVSFTGDAITAVNAGSYTVSPDITGLSATNYSFSTVNGTLTVSKAPLTVTANDQTKVYGSANPALTITYSGFVNGEAASVLATTPTAATQINVTTSAGTYADAITVSGGVDENYSISYVAGDFTVTKAPLTVTANDQTKVYGSANPALTVAYSGFVNGESTSVLATAPTATTQISATTSVGTYADAITVTGGVDENYSFSYIAGDFTVTKASLTVTANDQTKVYGSANPALTVAYSGFVNGESASVLATAPNATTQISATTNVGTYADAITVTGGVDENYSFTYVAGDFTVTKASLTVTANDQTKVYGSANPALTITYSGFVNGETASVLATAPTASTQVGATTSAGTYADAITVTGGVDENYSFVYIAGDFTVTKASLTVTANDQTKVYGSANPALTVAYSGFVNGESTSVLATAPTATTQISATTNVGTYADAITVTGGVDENYSFSYVAGDFTVTKASLTVTANDQTKVYGSANPALTVAYSGFVNGESASVLATAPTASTQVNATTNAGTYADAITVTGGVDENYSLTYVAGDFTVTKAPLTVTANDQTKVYGSANPALTITYSGFVNGETASVLATAPTAATQVNGTTNAGTYADAITVTGGVDENYSISYIAGDFTVTKAPLTVTANDQTKVYGSANPALTITYSGFVNGETASLLATVPTASTQVGATTSAGTYADAITVSGGVDENYSFTYVAGDFTVTKASLTVTANDQTKVYGSANPALTVAYSGFVNGESASVLATAPTASTQVNATTNAGTYADAITVTGGVDENYSFSYVAGDFTVTKATPTVQVNSGSYVFDGTAKSATGFAYGVGGTSDVLSPAVTITYTGTDGTIYGPSGIAPSAIGSYQVKADFAGNTNYVAISATASLIIANTVSTITVTGQGTYTYNGQAQGPATSEVTGSTGAVTYVYTGIAGTTFGPSSTPPINAGSYQVVATVAADATYQGASSAAFVFAIQKASLTVTASPQGRVYGIENPQLTLTYEGFVGGDDETVIDELPLAMTDALKTSDVGTYTIMVSGGNDNNYHFIYREGVLTIAKAQATIQLLNLEQAYTGKPLEVSYQTTPAGLLVLFQYDGINILPAELGEYVVTAVVSDKNYVGSVTGIFKILEDQDGDGIPDIYDQDYDNDGVPDHLDKFPEDSNEWADSDGDGIGDNADTDDDNDGVDDVDDAFPNDPDEWEDSDGDGIGNNADSDDDGDGVADEDDAFPLDPDEWLDSDGDGIGDNADPDDDNDGTPDEQDAFPFDPNEDTDSDGDGVGDNSDLFPLDPEQSDDQVAPELDVTQLTPLTLVCGIDFEEQLIAWLDSQAGVVATDNHQLDEWSHDLDIEAILTGLCDESKTIPVEFTVTDYSGNSSSFMATLVVVVNVAPEIITPLEDVVMAVNASHRIFTSPLPGEMFGDDQDQALEVRYFALGSDTLPSWAKVVNDTLVFSPAIADTGCYQLVVEARDIWQAAVTDTFQVCIRATLVNSDPLAMNGHGIIVYPNPASDFVRIKPGKQPETPVEVTLMNLSGQTVLHRQFWSDEPLEIDLAGQKTGMYVIRIAFNNQTTYDKLMIERR